VNESVREPMLMLIRQEGASKLLGAGGMCMCVSVRLIVIGRNFAVLYI
jgi:hypothetical protein